MGEAQNRLREGTGEGRTLVLPVTGVGADCRGQGQAGGQARWCERGSWGRRPSACAALSSDHALVRFLGRVRRGGGCVGGGVVGSRRSAPRCSRCSRDELCPGRLPLPRGRPLLCSALSLVRSCRRAPWDFESPAAYLSSSHSPSPPSFLSNNHHPPRPRPRSARRRSLPVPPHQQAPF